MTIEPVLGSAPLEIAFTKPAFLELMHSAGLSPHCLKFPAGAIMVPGSAIFLSEGVVYD